MENYGLTKSRQRKLRSNTALDESPFAPHPGGRNKRLTSAVTPDKSKRMPFQNMQVKQLTNGLQLEFNWKINIHSLSQNRSRKGRDRDSSLTSGRKKSEHRSRAAACDIRGFSTSKKLRGRRPRHGDDDE